MKNKTVIVARIKQLAKTLNYDYDNIEFLVQAMNREPIENSDFANQSLATLGDSVLGLAVTERLFKEGFGKEEITNRKKEIVDNKSLFDISERLQIYKNYYNSDGKFYDEVKGRNRIHHSAHDDSVEAVIGAIYLDKGFEYAKEWTIKFLRSQGEKI